MEIKDWIYVASIFLTFTVSAYSVYLNRLNRRNVAREHLYREQFEFYKDLSKRCIEIIALFNRVIANQINIEIARDTISNELVDFHKVIIQNAFLVPNSLETQLRRAVKEAKDLLNLLNTKGHLDEDDNHNVSVAYSDLIDYIRNEIGADKLSDENKRLFGSVMN